MATSKIMKPTVMETITSDIEFSNGITLQAGGVYRIGKLIIVQLRIISSNTIVGGSKVIESGLPKPADSAVTGNSCASFYANIPGLILYCSYSEGFMQVFSASTAQVSPNITIYINGAYISE